ARGGGPPGLPGTQSRGRREGGRRRGRRIAQGRTRTGHAINRTRGVRPDPRGASWRRPLRRLEAPPAGHRRDEGGRAPEGVAARGRRAGEGGAHPVGPRRREDRRAASASEELNAFVRARITNAQGLKIDVDEMSDLVRRSRLAFGVQNYHEGLRLLNEANERASKMTALHRQAYNAIASGAAFVAEAK